MTTSAPIIDEEKAARLYVGAVPQDWYTLRRRLGDIDLRVIRGLHDKYMAELRDRVEREFMRPAWSNAGEPLISNSQLVNALPLTSFNLSQLKTRGAIQATDTQHERRAAFSRDQVDAFMRACVDRPSDRPASPLFPGFVRWLEDTGRIMLPGERIVANSAVDGDDAD